MYLVHNYVHLQHVHDLAIIFNFFNWLVGVGGQLCVGAYMYLHKTSMESTRAQNIRLGFIFIMSFYMHGLTMHLR